MGVDDNLLAESNSTSQETTPENEDSDLSQGTDQAPKSTPNQPKSLREAVRAEKVKRNAEEEKKAAEAEKSNPLRQQTSSLLRSAWMNLIASFGLTLLWIDAHIFLRSVLGKSMFCAYGDEWRDRPGIKPPNKEEAKDAKMIKIVEPMGVACCNFGCLLVLLGVMVVIAMIAGVVDFLMDLVKGWFTGMFSWWTS